MANKKDDGKEHNVQANNQEEHYSSSLELIWKNAYQELDSWAERLDYQDEVLLNTARKYVDRVNQNRENIRVITEQFNKELREWEGTAREEFLMTTTILHQFFPKKSYHEINLVMDDIHNKTAKLILTPINAVSFDKVIDKYLDAFEYYVSIRKESRQEYIKNVKRTANLFYENQKIIFNSFTKQLKTTIFPLQKYMEQSR